MASALFVRQPHGHKLQPTALVHEAWLELAGGAKDLEGRSHFFSIAARAMRQVLTDYARARRTDRRGKGWQRVTFDDQLASAPHDYDLVDNGRRVAAPHSCFHAHAREGAQAHPSVRW